MSDNRMTDIERELRLESDAQQSIRDMVRGLPDEPVSLEWRSQLNERLLAAATPKRRPTLWLWPVAAGACATALALALLGDLTKQPTATPSALAESRLIAAHETTAMMLEIAGPGLSDVEADQPTSTPESEELWTPSDVDAL